MSLASFLCSLVLSQQGSAQLLTLPSPTSGIRLMTTGDAGRCFWGPNGIMTRTLDYFAKATTEFRTFAARKAEAILLLRAAPADRAGRASCS